MRIIILSIALLFCAFSAQSQVLKSAGVWYFLDVDSMTARPAVLPNGTEIAYVVGAKTVYYWNRNTSTWTAYGSTFGRDSIYFDSSIVGSGTVSNPWGVDSMLFATISGVGDSIASAVANYFPLQGGTLTGTGGAGFIGLPSQVTAPGTPVSGLNIYAQGSSFNWKGTDGFERQFASTLTGGRTYTLPDVSGTFALGTGTTNRVPIWTGTNTLGNSNIQDNNTAVSILNSKPFQLGRWTTAGRPAGVNGYMGYNTSENGIEWYNGSRWSYALESTIDMGTSTYVPFFNTNGQLTQSAKLKFTDASNVLNINSATADGAVSAKSTSAAQWVFYGENPGSGSNQNGLAILSPSMPNGGFVYDFFGRSITTNGGIQIRYRYSTTSGNELGDYGFWNNNYIITFSAARKIAINSTTGTGTTVPDYLFDVRGTDAIAFPRGTVAQRPTIVSSTTPMRYNTDSTALEYGESVGIWRQLSTRAYVRSLVSPIPKTWLKPEIEANRSVDIRLGGTDTVKLKMDGSIQVRGEKIAGDIRAGAVIPGIGKGILNPVLIVGSDSLFAEYGAGTDTIKTVMHINASSAFRAESAYKGYGNRIALGKRFAGGTTGDSYNISSAIEWFQDAANNTGSRIRLMSRNFSTGERNYMSLYGTGTLIVGNWIDARNVIDVTVPDKGVVAQKFLSVGKALPTKRFQVFNDVGTELASVDSTGRVMYGTYGVGIREAADLSKTQSNYIAAFATDGTVLDLNRDTIAKTEKYYTVTSTSSPQTLSNDFPDNLINQGGTQATFTLKFPASPKDGQLLYITYNNAITALTLDGNGNTIVGSAVITAVAGSQRKFKFYTGIGWIKQY